MASSEHTQCVKVDAGRDTIYSDGKSTLFETTNQIHMCTHNEYTQRTNMLISVAILVYNSMHEDIILERNTESSILWKTPIRNHPHAQ